MSTVARTTAPLLECEERTRPWATRRAAAWYPLSWTPLLLAAPLVDAVRPVDLLHLLVLLLLAALHTATVVQRRSAGPGVRSEALVLVSTLVVAGYQVLWNEHQMFLYPLLALGMATGIRPRRAMGVVGALAVSGAVGAGFTTGSPAAALALAAMTVMAGLSTHLIGRLAEITAQLTATREHLARTAVVEERERFSRDLHDLLGHTLSVIVVKAEAARRFAAADPAAAAEHAQGIEDIGRTALSQVREAVAGYREAPLRDELEHARQVLGEAGVAVEVRGAETQLPVELERLFARVIREGSTNVMRHADARRCSLLVENVGGEATVEVCDDGTVERGSDVVGDHPAGTGLAGLRERAARLGGVLVAGYEDGGFRLGVSVPVPGAGSDS